MQPITRTYIWYSSLFADFMIYIFQFQLDITSHLVHTVLNLINRSIKKVHCSVYLVIILTYFSKYNFHPGNIKYSDYNYC